VVVQALDLAVEIQYHLGLEAAATVAWTAAVVVRLLEG
jgi:hypothetical protein